MENDLKNSISELKNYQFVKILKNCKDYILVKLKNEANKKFDGKFFKNKIMYSN